MPTSARADVDIRPYEKYGGQPIGCPFFKEYIV